LLLHTRFAPSPTGLLHVGNAYSALQCQAWAEQHHAQLLLRIEDIDFTRCRPEFTDAIIEDLGWLGLQWSEPIRHQSRHADDYQQAISQLRKMGVIYPCFCTRKEIANEISRMASAPHSTDAATKYPGTCRKLHADEQERRMCHEPFAWRLHANKSMALAGNRLTWCEASGLRHSVNIHHDEIIGRRDIHVSYHLAVVVDDALQGISYIIRGHDLAASTGIHRLLQQLLALPEPVYIHHQLLLDCHGARLAKRNHATTLSSLRRMGVQASRLREFLVCDPPPYWPFDQAGEGVPEETILRMLGKR